MRQVTDLTGVNPVSMGEQPTPETGKAVTEYAILGTNDILKGILKRTNILKSNVARSMCLRLSHVVSADPNAFNAYKDVVGATSLQLLKIAEGHDVKYGIRTHARPTQTEIQGIREMLAMALKNGRDGKARITEADYIRFESMISSGESLKQIALLLDFALDKAQAAEEAKASQLQRENIQGTQMLEQQKEQKEARMIMLEAQAEISKENTKGRNAILEKAVMNNEMTALEALSMLGGTQQPQAPNNAPETPENVQKEERVLPTGEEGV